MCRNIKTLFNFAPAVTEDEIRPASLQFVRKISGFNSPSKANQAAFFSAVAVLETIVDIKAEKATPDRWARSEAATPGINLFCRGRYRDTSKESTRSSV